MPSDPDPGAPVWQDTGGEAGSDSNLEALISCAAHDAGLTRPSEVTSKTFLHTYIAFLVRKGVKLSELDKVVGNLSPTILAAYGVFSPPGAALPLDSAGFGRVGLSRLAYIFQYKNRLILSGQRTVW
jgi:hypothetical protein